MDEALRQESEKLTRSWSRHEAGVLSGYLVSGVEDPRLNLQSILSRHFLIGAATGEGLGALMDQECRFGAVMNWLVKLVGQFGDPEEPASILYALGRGADNAEGIEIPSFVVETFRALPATANGLIVPNYIQSFLSGLSFENGRTNPHQQSLDIFCRLWSRALLARSPETCSSRSSARNYFPRPSTPDPRLLSVLEPACGSANDYRFVRSFGIARLLDYAGFDLCETNVRNARVLFPGARFDVANVFDIPSPDKSFDLCFVHDLFEHLSLAGLLTAVKEICRVTRRGICVGFFNMDEIREHVVRPVEEYHWNKLSMARTRELFAGNGFTGQVIHIGTFLRQQIGCEETHNPNAYTFVLASRR